MNARRPRWPLLGLIFAVIWLLRQLSEWYPVWRASRSPALSSRRKPPPRTRWPLSLPPHHSPASRSARRSAPRRQARRPRRPQERPSRH